MSPLLESGDQRHLLLESYRNLRSSLRYLPVDGERPKTILITSALPEEGKSTVAANLARTLALGGSRVLLVDGDLRRGILHEMLGFSPEPGLAELLRRSSDLASAIQVNSLPNLAFIARGANSLDPGDLFLAPALDDLIVRWRKEYDCVVIDSSPVSAADDAPTLAPKVDGTLFVIRSRFCRFGAAREALDLLDRRQARVLGLIFNRFDPSARSNKYYKYGDYHQPGRKA
jgi:capsular exopolysaccharide synthesis family protein